MRLNFANLSDPLQKTGGQAGTPGTASNGAGFTRPHIPETTGDTRGHMPEHAHAPQPQPAEVSPVSPSCPQSWERLNPCIGAVVPTVPSVPTKNGTNTTQARFKGWLLHFPDRDPLEVWFVPPVDCTEALSDYPEAIAAEPFTPRPMRQATRDEARELAALVAAVLAVDTQAERDEALRAALADADGALPCYRALAEAKGLPPPRPATGNAAGKHHPVTPPAQRGTHHEH